MIKESPSINAVIVFIDILNSNLDKMKNVNCSYLDVTYKYYMWVLEFNIFLKFYVRRVDV